jgi:RNA polymerase sigma-70 factor (ECF subfamily)
MADEDPRWRAWLGAAQAGDNTAYAALLRAILPWLRGRARSRWPGSGAAEIEDIVQEALLALHQNRHLYDPSRPAAPFLYGILKLRGAEVRRRRQRHAGREAGLDEAALTVPSPAEQESATGARQLGEAMAALPARDRHVLELVKMQELPLAEASARSGLSVPVLKTATFRALARLRKLMGADHGH